MKLNEAIEVLKERSAWIRSYFGESTHAKAIDTVVAELEKTLPTGKIYTEVDMARFSRWRMDSDYTNHHLTEKELIIKWEKERGKK